jgi:Tfp pilus assembly protein PilV
MPGVLNRPVRTSRRRSGGEAGFMLVEVMVSAVLLIVLSLGTLSLIDGSQNMSAQSRNKSIASNLAHVALDRVRQSKFTTATNFTTVDDPRAVDGRTYHVVTTGTWSSAVGSVTGCTKSSGNAGQYVHVSSTVTWTGMGNVRPVVADTIIAPRAGEVDVSTGSFVFQAQNVAGLPLSGAVFSMNGQSLTTGTAGCVAFLSVPPGTYTTTYSKVGGYVATTGVGTGSYDAIVTKGNASSKTVLLDVAAKITPISFKREDGSTPLPTWGSYSLSSNRGQDFLDKYYGTAGTSLTNTTTTLFPFANGYQVYAGDCTGNDPTFYKTTYATTFPESAVAPAPGATVGATAYLRKVTVTATNVPKNGVVGFNFYANHATTLMASCTLTGGRITGTNTGVDSAGTNPSILITNTTSKAGTVTYTDDLPYGVYSLCLDYNNKAYTYKASASAINNTPPSSSPLAPSGTLTVQFSGTTPVPTTPSVTPVTGTCTDANQSNG